MMGDVKVSDKQPNAAADYIPLTPVALNVLLALADRERHGYGIMKEVGERTHGEVRLGPGTLYGAIKRLEEGCMIEESETRPDPAIDDERRRYYRLTDFGKQVLATEIERLESLVTAAREKGAYPMPRPNVGST